MGYSPFLQAHRTDFFEIRAIVLFIKYLHSFVGAGWGEMLRQSVGECEGSDCFSLLIVCFFSAESLPL